MLCLTRINQALVGRNLRFHRPARDLCNICFAIPKLRFYPEAIVNSQIRTFTSTESSEKNAMTLSKSVSRMSFTQESGTINVVKVPNLGKNTKRCKIYKWLKKPGDYVNVDDLLCILETDLVFGKVHSLVAGTIVENVNQEGSTVAVGSDLALLADDTLVSPRAHDVRPGGFSSDGRRWFSTKKYTPMLSFVKSKLVPMEVNSSSQLQVTPPKYVPMISFGKHKSPVLTTLAETSQSSTSTHPQTNTGNTKKINVLDDFYKSPFQFWFRNISEEEINMVNHGTKDVK